MIRRDMFQRLGGYREDLVTGEDGDMMLRLSRIGRTYFEPRISILYPGRREHAVGWIRLLSIWMFNYSSVTLFDKSRAKDWTPVR